MSANLFQNGNINMTKEKNPGKHSAYPLLLHSWVGAWACPPRRSGLQCVFKAYFVTYFQCGIRWSKHSPHETRRFFTLQFLNFIFLLLFKKLSFVFIGLI